MHWQGLEWMDGHTLYYQIECWNGTKISLVGKSQDTQEFLTHVMGKHPLCLWLLVLAHPRAISRHEELPAQKRYEFMN